MSTPCHVWWAAPVPPAGAPGLLALLDPHERDRIDRFRQAPDQARFLAAHALTRLVLGELLDRPAAELAFDRTCRCGEQHGKPVLVGPGPAFSVTHAGDLVGVAVYAGGPVGLDVEQVRDLTDLDGMARHVCSPAELREPLPGGAGGFFRVWTRKEALLKATGEGLSSPMAAITLDAAGVREWTGDGAPTGPVWLHDMAPAADYPGAVAGIGPAPSEIVEVDGNALLASTPV